MIRVFIVAASPLARAGFENLLGARGVQIVGSTAVLEAVMDLLSDAAPDIILIDATGDGFEAVLDSITSTGLVADAGVVLLVDAAASSSEALRAGVRAALPSDISPEQLFAALDAAASGLLVMHPSQASELLPAGAASRRASDELVESLTRRESEVLRMLAAGLSNKEIASRLKISEHTAKFHVASILGKLGAGSRTEAVSVGIRRGLVLL